MKIINSFKSVHIPHQQRVSNPCTSTYSFKSSDVDSFEHSEQTVPSEYVLLFENLKKIDGKDLVRTSYFALLNILNISPVAQKNIYFPLFNWLVPADANAAADPASGSITVYRGLLKEKDKWDKLGFIAHEVYHVKQYTDILRLENLDKEAYVDAVTDLTYPLASDEKKIELKESLRWSVDSFQKKALELGEIKQDSEEGKHALKLFDALINYPRLNKPVSMEVYTNNLLEKEAYAFQDKVYELAKLYNN